MGLESRDKIEYRKYYSSNQQRHYYMGYRNGQQIGGSMFERPPTYDRVENIEKYEILVDKSNPQEPKLKSDLLLAMLEGMQENARNQADSNVFEALKAIIKVNTSTPIKKFDKIQVEKAKRKQKSPERPRSPSVLHAPGFQPQSPPSSDNRTYERRGRCSRSPSAKRERLGQRADFHSRTQKKEYYDRDLDEMRGRQGFRSSSRGRDVSSRDHDDYFQRRDNYRSSRGRDRVSRGRDNYRSSRGRDMGYRNSRGRDYGGRGGFRGSSRGRDFTSSRGRDGFRGGRGGRGRGSSRGRDYGGRGSSRGRDFGRSSRGRDFNHRNSRGRDVGFRGGRGGRGRGRGGSNKTIDNWSNSGAEMPDFNNTTNAKKDHSELFQRQMAEFEAKNEITDTVSDQQKIDVVPSNVSLPSNKIDVIPEKKSEDKSPPTPEPAQASEHNFENEFSDSDDEPVTTAKPCDDSDSDI